MGSIFHAYRWTENTLSSNDNAVPGTTEAGTILLDVQGQTGGYGRYKRYIGLHFGSKKTGKISIAFEDLLKISIFFRTEVIISYTVMCVFEILSSVQTCGVYCEIYIYATDTKPDFTRFFN